MKKLAPSLIWMLVLAGVGLAQGSDATTLVRDPSTEADRIADVMHAGAKLIGKPNSAALHVETAMAYFRRGALEDSTRVTRHIQRAVELDPFVEETAERAVQNATAGLMPDALPSDAQAFDTRIQRTIPASSQADPVTADGTIRSSLATRIARSLFREEPVNYKKNVEAYRKLFGVSEDRKDPSWRQRVSHLEQSLRGNQAGVTAALDRRMLQVARTGIQDLDEESTDPSADVSPPAAIEMRGLAFIAFRTGKVEKALEYTIRTAAAAQAALKTREGKTEESGDASRELSTSAPDREFDVPEAPPTRDQELPPPIRVGSTPERSDPDRPASTSPATPARVETSPPPRIQLSSPAPSSPPPSREMPSPPPPREQTTTSPPPSRETPPSTTTTSTVGLPGTPPRQQTPSTPADRTRQIGEAALEAGEAIRNEGVCPREVNRKLRELASIGAVGEPLVMDCNGNGRLDATAGSRRIVSFDLDGDSREDAVEWLDPRADGLLCCDVDGDGIITSARELFGTLRGYEDGFARLAAWDIDRDGRVSGRELEGLLVWIDDGDGRCSPGELAPVTRHGITEIVLPVGPEETGRARETGGAARTIWDWLPAMR